MRLVPAAVLLLLLAAGPATASSARVHRLHFVLGQGESPGPDWPMALAREGMPSVGAPAMGSRVADCQVDGRLLGAYAWSFEGQPAELLDAMAAPDGRGHVAARLSTRVPLPSGLMLARLDAPGLDGGPMVTKGAVGSTYVPSMLPGDTQTVEIEWAAARDGLFLLEFGGHAVRLTLMFCPDLPAGQPAVASAEGALGQMQPLVTLDRATFGLDAQPLPLATRSVVTHAHGPPEARASPAPVAALLAVALLATAALWRRA